MFSAQGKLNVLFLLFLSTLCFCGAATATETPLMHAALHADIPKMKLLIQAGANVNDVADREQPHGGKPVLRYAIDSNCIDAVHTLLEAGSNPNDFTESPIIYRESSHKANMRNLSLLSHAINVGAPLSIIKALITYGAHLDGSPKIAGGWSPLMIAAFKGNKEAVIALLHSGSDTTAINWMDSKTALDYAYEGNSAYHREIVKILKPHKQQ